MTEQDFTGFENLYAFVYGQSDINSVTLYFLCTDITILVTLESRLEFSDYNLEQQQAESAVNNKLSQPEHTKRSIYVASRKPFNQMLL